MGAPEVRATSGITDEQRLFYETNGYLVLPNALAPDALADLRAAADRAEADWRADLSRPGLRTSMIEQIANIIEYDDLFLHLLEASTVFPIVQELMPDLAMIYNDYYIFPPRTAPQLHWHHDVTIDGPYHPLSTMFLKLTFHFSDVARESGPTALIPGSHKFLDEFALPKASDPEEMPGCVRMIAPAGDAWLFNARCYHAAMPNRSDVARKLLIYTYGHRWMKPRDGYAPSAELQAKAKTDVMRQLLHLADPYPVEHAEIPTQGRQR